MVNNEIVNSAALKGRNLHNRRLSEAQPTDKNMPLPVVRVASCPLKYRQCPARKQQICLLPTVTLSLHRRLIKCRPTGTNKMKSEK
jgi:hypothetical protein